MPLPTKSKHRSSLNLGTRDATPLFCDLSGEAILGRGIHASKELLA